MTTDPAVKLQFRDVNYIPSCLALTVVKFSMCQLTAGLRKRNRLEVGSLLAQLLMVGEFQMAILVSITS